MNFPFIWYKKVGRTFVRFVTINACDGHTERRTALWSRRPRCIQCSAVKMKQNSSLAHQKRANSVGIGNDCLKYRSLCYILQSMDIFWHIQSCTVDWNMSSNFMSTLLPLLFMYLLTGCAIIIIQLHLPDGTCDCVVYFGWLWRTRK